MQIEIQTVYTRQIQLMSDFRLNVRNIRYRSVCALIDLSVYNAASERSQ